MSRASRRSPTPNTVAQGLPGVRRSSWDLLTVALAGVILQYVWRIQEIFTILAPLQFTALVSAGAIALFALQSDPTRRLTSLRHPVFRPVLVIFLLAVISIPTSVHRGVSFTFLTSNFVKTVILTAILAASIRDRYDLDRLVRVFVLGGAGYVAAALAFAGGEGRLSAQGSYDPNDLGLYTVGTLALCIYLMRRSAGWMDRLIGVGSAVLLLIGTVQTGSRGGFLALVAVAVYGLLAMNAIRRSKRLTFAVLATAALLTFAGDAYWERIGTIIRPQDDYNWAGQAESGRVEIWKRGLGYMARRPLTGVGVDAFSIAEGTMAPQARRQQMGIGFKWSTAHNSYVQIGAELGVFGLVAFVAMLWAAFREARRLARLAMNPRDRLLAQVFGAMVVGYVVGCVFLSQAYATYLYFTFALLIGFSRIITREAAVMAQFAAAAPYQPASAEPTRAVAASRRGRLAGPAR